MTDCQITSNPTFYIKVGDLLPAIRAQLLGAGGSIQKLYGTAVEFHMKDADGVVVTHAQATIENEARGIVRYDWTEPDTDEAGTFVGEFEVSAGGKTMTFPNSGNITIIMTDELA